MLLKKMQKVKGMEVKQKDFLPLTDHSPKKHYQDLEYLFQIMN